MFIPILLLSLLGSTSAGFFRNAPSDGSEVSIENFMKEMNAAIANRSTEAISDLFTDNFAFTGCRGDYDKQRMTNLLSNIPPGTHYSITFESSHYIPNDKIEYNVTISGFNPFPVKATFVFKKATEQLEGGVALDCPKYRGFIGYSPAASSSFSDDTKSGNAQTTVENFLARMVRSMESKDRSIISALFQPGFIFKGCKGTYDKMKIVYALSHIPTGTKFTINLLSVEDLGDSIKYLMTVTGLKNLGVPAEFVLNKYDQQLESGRVPKCPEHQDRRFAVSEDSDAIVRKFLDYLKPTLASNDSTAIGKLFDDNFLFQGCRGNYTKTYIAQNSRAFYETSEEAILQSSKWNNNGQIEYIVSLPAPSEDFNGLFVLCPHRNVLISGNRPKCMARRARNSFLKQSEDLNAIVENFMTKFAKFVKTKDDFIIGELFQPNFTFRGCNGETYNREDSIKIMQNVPSGSKFTYKYKDISDGGGFIRVTVLVSGLGVANIEFGFVLNKNVQKLESAAFLACPPPSKHLRSLVAAPESSDVIIQRFLARLEQVIAHHEFSSIGKIFDDDFVFEGCHGTYDKAQAIEMITRSPSPFEFKLKSSKWNNAGQIEYTVAITGPNGDFDAHFVFCPERNVLKSGDMVSCPTPRKRGFRMFY